MTPLESLRALGTGEEAPAAAKARVHSALLAALEGTAVVATAGAMAPPKPVASVPPAPAALVAGAVSSKALTVALGIWLLGGVTGAALYGALRPEQVRVVYVDRPAAPLAFEPPPVLSSLPVPTVPAFPSSAPARPALAPAVVTSSSPGSELGRERALLELARTSAAQGEPALALQRAEQHRQQFPHGRLSEEREAIAIRALLALGRTGEARQRAQVFRASYPNSFLLPVIDSALSVSNP